MTITRPSLPVLRHRIRADIEYHLPGANARAEESILSTLAEAEAGAFHGLYGYADYLATQLLPDTADLEWLERWAIMLEVPRLPATPATGTVQAAGSGVVPVGTVFINPITRLLYQSTVLVTGDKPLIPITALDAGYAGNCTDGTALQLQRPVMGIPSDVRTHGGLTGGTDLETLDNWRGRVARKLAERSRIGDADDYALWAESSHAGVAHAWVYPNEMGIGTVVIRVIGPSPNIIPDNTVLRAAKAELDKLRNAAATLFVIAATPLPVDICIEGVSDTTLRTGIQRELALLFQAKQEQSALLRESEIDAAIQRYTLDYTLIRPKGNIQCGDKDVLVLGGITWDA